MQEPTRCLGRIPPTTTANVTGNTTFPTFVEGELQLTQTLDGHKVTPGRESFWLHVLISAHAAMVLSANVTAGVSL